MLLCECMVMEFKSRRSPVFSTKGIVASSQPLATAAGLSILEKGGNAVDAAVATAAVLNVVEPTSTGIGGDCFVLYYDSKRKVVEGLNGSGRAPSDLSLDYLRDNGITKLDPHSIHTITVPGAAAGWVDSVDRWGTLDMKEILKPAITLAESGFSVSPITSYYWSRSEKLLLSGPNGAEMLLNGHAPKPGQRMRNKTLANTFKVLTEEGKTGFYEGKIADAIVSLISSRGGVLNLDDLKAHHSTFDKPISTNYKGVEVYEIPPNGQGITALMALNILEEFDLESLYRESESKYYHILIEAMRLAFADTRWYVADPSKQDVPIEKMLSKKYASSRREMIDLNRATMNIEKGSPFTSSDTVYFSVVDEDRNACSFINSNYMGFGTGLVPKGTGFTLQNRGHNFSMDPTHPNHLAPNKRPYHTIIPGMATSNKELFSSFGVMGGFMQPQGHTQVLVNMIDFKMNPQEALDHYRFCIMDGTQNGVVALESSMNVSLMSQIASYGHPVRPMDGYGRSIFGRGQIINYFPDSDILTAGSDPRADGQASVQI